MDTSNTKATMRLTALWALSESGLGGMMHALKIPFTGFFLGGFAIVIITLIAQLSKQKFRTILQATFLVIMVKAAASPHSPPMAYIAVAFQGLAGACLYTIIPFTKVAAIIFGVIALLESAIQKVLVATLVFGKSLWEALDAFVASVLKDVSVFYEFSFSFWLVAIYTIFYVVWGMLLGWWAGHLYAQLQVHKQQVLKSYNNFNQPALQQVTVLSKKRNGKLIVTFLALLCIVLVFAFGGNLHKALYVILRTVVALILLFWIITPLLQWVIQYYVKRRQQSGAFVNIMQQLPQLKTYVKPALLLAQQQHSGLRVYPQFVRNLLILALYA
jgi:hypothetical protein